MEENNLKIRDVDLGFIARAVKRYRIWVILCPVILGISAYTLSRQSPKTYEASAVLLATNNVTSIISERSSDQATVSAPPLPEGVMAQALQSEEVVSGVILGLKRNSSISDIEKKRLLNQLTQETRDQKLKTISLSSRLDFNGNGTYTVTSKAREPEAARKLSNLVSEALVRWDRGRGLASIRLGLAGFDSQLKEIDKSLARKNLSSRERQSLLNGRARVQESKVRLSILENSAVGVLSPLVSAQTPRLPVSPKPLRNAVLAVILGLVLTIACAAVATISDRTIRTEEDLLPLGLPTLATLPRLRQRDVLLRGIVRAAREAGLYEAVGFLRVNLLGILVNRPHPVVMMTSTAPGEGKSSVTATLADGIASSGQRVLIIDADLRRGTQAAVWKKYDEMGTWKKLEAAGGARTTQEALMRPHEIEVLQVEPNVDILPAGPGITDSLSILNQADISQALSIWRKHYDVVLIDTAPLLALADGLVLGRHTDAVIMVVEYGQTHIHGAATAIRRAERAGLNIIGSVINKANPQEESSYNYSYSYGAPTQSGRA
ncbi:AAA family ATPase [Deinococcus taeanensis]|uniref:AAA family ATPase n=1 Tax=Deinococcus taeanensis TaxID=2737050 RepID=UPI001CDBDCD8|nr:AAA family ATPase [Deinococcus taeanensis]UBV42716.1 AAA family ATPase [Deinococcus taeanensis]